MKQSIGKQSEPIDIAELIRNSCFRELPITFHHAITAGRLPLIHHDPFDRMLVAQAQREGLTLTSRDPHIEMRRRSPAGVTPPGVASADICVPARFRPTGPDDVAAVLLE